jgi:hypothetical protein
MAVGIADVIEDHRLLLPRCGTQSAADRLQVQAQGIGGAHQDHAAA